MKAFHLSASIGFGFIIACVAVAFIGLSALPSNVAPSFDFFYSAYFRQILTFTIWQATLSTLISLLLGYVIARALYYVRTLPAKQIFLTLCLLCFVFPTLVLITALALLLGHNSALIALVSKIVNRDINWSLYGINGIVIAHVFLNAPLVIRVIYTGLMHISDTSWQLARQLKLSKWTLFWQIEWPMLRSTLIGVAFIIFSLCFNSFAIVLALGGGPKSTTLEVAIFQALKYDFNLNEALLLSWVQFAIISALFLFSARYTRMPWINIDQQTHYYLPKATTQARYGYTLLYYITWFFLSAPILYLIYKFIQVVAQTSWHASWSSAIFTTLALSILSTLIASIISYCIMHTLRAREQRSKSLWVFAWISTIPLITPAMVLAVGVFIFQLHYLGQIHGNLLAVIIINSLLVIPFIVQQWRPRLNQFDYQYAQLIRTLKLSFWQKLTIEWHYCRQARNQAAILSLLLCMGDVAVISVLGPNEWPTLPILIYRYAGSYQLDNAAVLSVILLSLYFILVYLFQKQQTIQSE